MSRTIITVSKSKLSNANAFIEEVKEAFNSSIPPVCFEISNREEVEEMKFVDVEHVMRDVLLNPDDYAAWFMPALLIATEGTEFGSLNPEASDRLIY